MFAAAKKGNILVAEFCGKLGFVIGKVRKNFFKKKIEKVLRDKKKGFIFAPA